MPELVVVLGVSLVILGPAAYAMGSAIGEFIARGYGFLKRK